MIENPQRMQWPERKPGVGLTYGAESQRVGCINSMRLPESARFAGRI
jgi:hypothetical protein